ncbi:hypothetical protein LQG66_24825 [Bradyrhizobium ontarionense]|uniref:Uncharacterized protein n=1 Tax=Bradyrhizobium ontarionense TaxID=2898149 RepID=A0ABY3R5A6_9BRAD|nr:hypothetical protein [Bradyrhizobium sp. A19]UFZ02496.1 hypothetical protein LQG66_24825 [Bradyrhizobium sp. A19]
MTATAVHAEDGLKGTDTLHGTCRKLTIAGRDRASDCKDVLLNTRYVDGRTGFYFVTLDGTMITFSSPGGLAQRQHAKTLVYPIDAIIFKIEGEIRKIPARGACRPANPTNASSSLSCQADSELCKFGGEFLTGATKAAGP